MTYLDRLRRESPQRVLSAYCLGLLTKKKAKMESFFNVKTSKEVFEIIDRFEPAGEETIALEESLGRILSQNLVSPEDLPGFFRSTVDGYAVTARDTFGASESLPALLEVSGEVLMGRLPTEVISRGQAARISTGGMLPPNTDGVVMVEYCNPIDETTLEVSRAISPMENIIQPGDDFRKGETVLKKGRRLLPHDLGVMAGLGWREAPVYTRPLIAIISTGDEIVTIDKTPAPGQVRDINRYTLGAFCTQHGAKPLYMGLCPDKLGPMRHTVSRAVEEADAVWISGGSSVGTRDLTLEVFEELKDFQLLAHGISISPGKPTIIGQAGLKPVIGLPGHVASALVVSEVFLKRLIIRLSGLKNYPWDSRGMIRATLSRNIESANGREDYIRVTLIEKDNLLWAEPVFGKSGLISTLVQADGLIRVDINIEGLYQGQQVDVLPLDPMRGGIF